MNLWIGHANVEILTPGVCCLIFVALLIPSWHPGELQPESNFGDPGFMYSYLFTDRQKETRFVSGFKLETHFSTQRTQKSPESPVVHSTQGWSAEKRSALTRQPVCRWKQNRTRKSHLWRLHDLP